MLQVSLYKYSDSEDQLVSNKFFGNGPNTGSVNEIQQYVSSLVADHNLSLVGDPSSFTVGKTVGHNCKFVDQHNDHYMLLTTVREKFTMLQNKYMYNDHNAIIMLDRVEQPSVDPVIVLGAQLTQNGFRVLDHYDQDQVNTKNVFRDDLYDHYYSVGDLFVLLVDGQTYYYVVSCITYIKHNFKQFSVDHSINLLASRYRYMARVNNLDPLNQATTGHIITQLLSKTNLQAPQLKNMCYTTVYWSIFYQAHFLTN